MQEKIRIYASYVIVGFGGIFVVYVFFKYLFAILLPFLIGWIAALAVRRPASFLHKKLKLSEGALRLVLAVSAVAAVGASLTFGIKTLVYELSRLSQSIGEVSNQMLMRLTAFIARLPSLPFLKEGGEDLLDHLTSLLMRVLPPLISGLVTALPSLLLSVGVGGIAAVYFCLDLDRIHEALHRFIPSSWQAPLHRTKEKAFHAAFTVLKANLLLMLIAFGLMLVGFLLLRIPYPLLLSGVFALFDFLPVIGVGTFLVPWGIWLLLSGSVGQGIGILVLFVVISIVRQLTEPHLIGRGSGMHPLLTLLSMYAGARLAGAVGILLGPMLALILYGVLFPPSERAEPHRTAPQKRGRCEKRKES